MLTASVLTHSELSLSKHSTFHELPHAMYIQLQDTEYTPSHGLQLTDAYWCCHLLNDPELSFRRRRDSKYDVNCSMSIGLVVK